MLITRPDLPPQTGISGVYWIESNSSLMLIVSASETDTGYRTSYANWTVYDKPFDDSNINSGTERLIWTQRGPNPQTFTLNTKLHPKNLPSGVHKVTFFTSKEKCDGTGISAYFAINNPDENEGPYIREIPQITLHEGDQIIINLDDLGIDPDPDKNNLGRITYSIISVKPEINGVKLCGINPLTNNQNYILTLAPGKSGLQTAKDISVTIRATDGGTPSKYFDRTFTLTILPQDGLPKVINPSSLQNCLTEELTLDLDKLPQAQITTLPKLFNIVKLLNTLNIQDKTTILKFPSDKSNLFRKWLSSPVDNENFVTSLVAGGRAYVGLRFGPEINLAPDEVQLLKFLIKSKADNKTYDSITKIVSYNADTRELLLEVQLTDEIPPGDVYLILTINKDQSTKLISKAEFKISPRVFVTSIIHNKIISKPVITEITLTEIPDIQNTGSTKKQYLLKITGHNFMRHKVEINNQTVRSPVANQPFTTITFTDNSKITLKQIRVPKSLSEIKRVLIKARLEYDSSVPVTSDDIRYFTVSTLNGQDTGKVTFRSADFIQKIEPADKPASGVAANKPPDKSPDKTLSTDQTITITNPGTAQAPVFTGQAAPLTNLVNSGRPAEFTGTPGRPPSAFPETNKFTGSVQFNTNKKNVSQNYQANNQFNPPAGRRPFNERFFQPPPSFPQNQNIQNIPEVKLIPAETLSFRSDTSLDINIKSLDLSGANQVIYTPKIPLISFSKQTLETALIETASGKPSNVKKQVSDQPAQTSETHGIIKSGFGGYIIKLNSGIKLKEKDLKNINYVIIDTNKKTTVIPGNTQEIKSGSVLLSRLFFPESINSGVATLVTVLNKGGGKKEVLSKGTVKLFNSYDFQNVGEAEIKTGLPKVKQIQGRVTGSSKKGGKIIRLILSGENFASRLIKINGREFISEPSKSHTFVSFSNESDIEILRTRVLNKGKQILLLIRFTGDDISKRSFTVSTPKGQFFSKKMEIKLLSKPPVRNVILELDNETDKTEIKPQNKKG